jgi:diacylglycerol kinase family enzyme
MLELDGEVVADTATPVFSAGLYNARHYPLRVVMSPDADLSDGLGEGVVYHTASAYWSTVASGLRGGARGARSAVTRRTWSTARLQSEGPFQIDGESVEGGSFSVRLEPGAFRVLVP